MTKNTPCTAPAGPAGITFLAVLIPDRIDSALGPDLTIQARQLKTRYITAKYLELPSGPAVKVTAVARDCIRASTTYRPTQYMGRMLLNAVEMWITELHASKLAMMRVEENEPARDFHNTWIAPMDEPRDRKSVV